MTWQDKVMKELNRSFNEPFMPDGFCKARIFKDSWGNKVLQIQLGDRDVEFDSAGNPIASGSNMGEAIEWEIKKGNK